MITAGVGCAHRAATGSPGLAGNSAAVAAVAAATGATERGVDQTREATGEPARMSAELQELVSRFQVWLRAGTAPESAGIAVKLRERCA